MDRRFWKHVDVSLDNECWPWLQQVLKGYGRHQWTEDGEHYTVIAHRYAWEDIKGPIPDDMTIDHICKNKSCQNVKHMQLVSRRTNIRRGHTDSREHSDAETHCVNGHEMTVENTQYRSDRVKPVCRTCQRDKHRASDAKRSEARKATYVKKKDRV